MNPPSEISPSTQLILDEIRKLHTLFDKFDARWVKQDAVREASRGVTVPTQSAALGADVVADNWGGLFNECDDSDEQHCGARSIVADNWGGLFEQPAHILEERDFESTDQIRIESCITYTDPDAPACVTPAPTASTAASEQFSASQHIVVDNWGGLFEEPARVLEERIHDFSAGEGAFTDQWFVDALNTPAPHPAVPKDLFGLHTVELSPVPAAARAQSDAADTPRHHAAALVTAAPVLFTPGVPRPSVQYQFPRATSPPPAAPVGPLRLPRSRLARRAPPPPRPRPRRAPPLRRPRRVAPRPPRHRRPRRARSRLPRLCGPRHAPPRLPWLPRTRSALPRPPRRARRRRRTAGVEACHPLRPTQRDGLVVGPRRVRLPRRLLCALAAGPRPHRRRLRQPQPRRPRHPLPPRRARRHATAPTLLSRLDAATTSPIPTPPREGSLLALAAACSQSGAHSVHAARVFVEMSLCHQPLSASMPTPVFTFQCAALPSAAVLHARTAVRGAALSAVGRQGLAIIHDTSALQAEELLSCGGDFTNPCDFNLIGAPVVYVRSCDVNVVSLWLLFSLDWAEQQPWLPPSQVQVLTEQGMTRVVVGNLLAPEPGSLWPMLPWPPPQSKGIWFQLSVSYVLHCAVHQCRVTFIHCMKYQEGWKHWLELLQGAVQDELNCRETVHWLQSFCAAIILLHLINDRRAMLLLSQWGLIILHASMLKRVSLVGGEHLVVTVTSNMQPLFQCCPIAVARIRAADVSATRMETGILQITIVRCYCHLLALVELMNGQTDPTATYYYMHTCWDCNSLSILVYGKYLATALLVQDGNQQSCYRIYRDARSSTLALSLQKLGIEKLTNDNVQQWVASNMKIGTWTHIMQITVHKEPQLLGFSNAPMAATCAFASPSCWCWSAEDTMAILLLLWCCQEVHITAIPGFESWPQLYFQARGSYISGLGASRLSRRGECQRLLHVLLVCAETELQENSSFLLDVTFANLLHTYFIESSRRSDTCVALFGMGEELISLTEHCSLLHLRQEHPRLLLHAQRQRGGSVVFPADPNSSTNSAAT